MLRTLLSIVLLAGCDEPAFPIDGGAPDIADAGRDGGVADAEVDAGSPVDASTPDGFVLLVTLDGVPAEDVRVVQGGREGEWRTGADGRVVVDVDETVPGEKVLIASHPEARIRGAFVEGRTATITLERFDASDNPDYPFQDPGEPDRRPNTAQCGHCHQTIDEDWFASPHRTSASNPHVHDLYAGTAHGFSDAAACADAGGEWREGPEPGTGGQRLACYAGDAVLALSPPTFGGCADCHAPGMDGRLSGRDLLEATEIAFDYGVHCDVCHRVAEVVPGEPAAFGGWLVPVRPSEPGAPALGAGGWLPLTFGPSHDSPNVRMGSVQRDHFREARFCGGCHQHDQAGLAGTIDRGRWPDGEIPVHSTYAEWAAGPMNPAAPCQSCHMPPDPSVLNAADLQRFPFATVGIQGGWPRAPGSVRRHRFLGPRTPEARMLEMAAAIFIERSVSQGVLTATVTVKNVGAGHAIPTGEPLRSMILAVDAACGAQALEATGGDAVPSFAGYLEKKEDGMDWSVWPTAAVGDVVRVVSLDGYRDYAGFGPFGDGTFDAVAKGLRVETVVGQAIVSAVDPISFDRPLPSGDVAYLVREDASAGRAGFAFARVLTGGGPEEMVPHFAATDVASDNRLLPQQSYTTVHRFDAPCADPAVSARLIYRRFPLHLARARGWSNGDAVMTEALR